MKIFIGGSINFKLLNKRIHERLNNMRDQGFHIITGDADGADKSVQSFFQKMKYPNLEIYCSGNICRNNLNNWPIHNVDVDSGIKGRKFYMVKDFEMAKDCDYGFMLWDGKSPGTMNNILNLLIENKKVLVYFSPLENFFTISDLHTLNQLLKECKSENIDLIDKKIQLLNRIAKLKDPMPEQLELII